MIVEMILDDFPGLQAGPTTFWLGDMAVILSKQVAPKVVKHLRLQELEEGEFEKPPHCCRLTRGWNRHPRQDLPFTGAGIKLQ